MTTVISKIVTLILLSGAVTLAYGIGIAVYFALNRSNYESQGCEASEVFRLSDRACYTPQGE